MVETNKGQQEEPNAIPSADADALASKRIERARQSGEFGGLTVREAAEAIKPDWPTSH